MTLDIFFPGPPAASTMPKVVDYFGTLVCSVVFSQVGQAWIFLSRI